jgi:rod shape-determining protein MreD
MMTEHVEITSPDRFFWSDIVTIPAAILAALFVQVSWENVFGAMGLRVDFITLLIVFLAFWREEIVAATSGFLAGIVLSLLTHEPLGITSATLVVLAYATGYVRRKIAVESAAGLFLLVPVMLLFQAVLLQAASAILGMCVAGFDLVSILLTAFAFLLLFPMLRTIFSRTRRINVHVSESGPPVDETASAPPGQTEP